MKTFSLHTLHLSITFCLLFALALAVPMAVSADHDMDDGEVQTVIASGDEEAKMLALIEVLQQLIVLLQKQAGMESGHER